MISPKIKSAKALGFTLVEIMVVLAIIAIISVVVIFLLNPGVLLKQSRDANRVADMSTIGTAIADYQSVGGQSMGVSGTIYLSIPDPSATTSAGTNCAALGFVGNYHCPSPQTYKSNNGTGWLPMNFSGANLQSVIASLPVDPVNTRSSGEYYQYEYNGSNWEIASQPESQKYLPEATSSAFAQGTSMNLITLEWGAPVGYTSTTVQTPYGLPYISIAFDSNTKTLWLSGGFYDDIINDDFSGSTHITLSTPANTIVFDSNTKTIWNLNGNGSYNTGALVNDTTHTIANIPLPITASNEGGVFDPATSMIWMPASTSTGAVVAINDSSPYASTTIPVFPVSYLQDYAYDSSAHTIWVAQYIPSGGSLVKINDTFPYATSTCGSMNYVAGLAFDSHTNSIWAINSITGNVMQVNDTSCTATTMPYTVASPDAIAFDSHSNSIWIGGANGLVQINDTTYASTTYPGPQITSLAFDSNNNTVWGGIYSSSSVMEYIPSN